MDILITGGAGFIGSHTAEKLVSLGHNITILDNFSTGKKSNLNNIQCEIIEGDILNIDTLTDKNYDVVYHFAAHMNVRDSVTNPIHDVNNNIIGGLHVLEYCKRKHVKKIIFSSSGGTVYGDAKQFPTHECYTPLNPICPYGISKLTMENFISFYKNTYNMNIIILRYANVYGIRQNSKSEAGVISIFSEKMLNNENPIIFGNGNQTRDFIYIDDVVKFNVACLYKYINNTYIYNIGTGIETSINNVFDILNSLFNNKFKKVYGAIHVGELERSCLYVDNTCFDFAISKYELTKFIDGIRIMFNGKY